MAATIYYFSGTGNSYTVAKGIADGLGARLVPMASAVKQDEITVDTECTGIVFPIYYVDAPNIVRNFIPKIKGLSGKYVFMACTYGGGRGNAVKTVRELVRQSGGDLAAAYGIHMPQNAFLKPRESKDALYKKMGPMVEMICRRTAQQQKGFRASEGMLDLILLPLTPVLKSMFHKYLAKTAQGGGDVSDVELIYKLDQLFKANDKCTGCGLCASVCPVRNIIMDAGKPVWNHRCENCLMCYNLCPNKAIDSGIAQKDYYYLHPGYSAKAARLQSGD